MLNQLAVAKRLNTKSCRISHSTKPGLPNRFTSEKDRKTIRRLCRSVGKDADFRKCMLENSRTYERMESVDRIASEPHEIHNMTPQQRQARFGNQWHPVQTSVVVSNTIPTRQHPELGQAHRARRDHNYTQRATSSPAETPRHKHRNRNC